MPNQKLMLPAGLPLVICLLSDFSSDKATITYAESVTLLDRYFVFSM